MSPMDRILGLVWDCCAAVGAFVLGAYVAYLLVGK